MANTIDTMLPEVLLRKIIDGTLEEFEDVNVTGIEARRFQSHTGLERICCPTLERTTTRTNHDSHTFEGCTNLEEIYMPELVGCGGGVGPFWGVGSSSHRTVAVLSSLKETLWSAFRTSVMEAVDIGPDYHTTAYLDNYWFFGATCYIYNLILRAPVVVRAQAAASISGIRNDISKVYVPSALLEEYKIATNWSAKDPSIFNAIEGSQYEHYYANGIPIVGGVTSNLVLILWLTIALRLASYRWEVMVNG